jgi:UDP-N-acetylmuramoyl-L-alanyl-D-glutamate--2,6-diaminopimelate ligase
VGELEAGDVLVLAGKGHERGQIVKGVVHPFDDAEQARLAVKEREA